MPTTTLFPNRNPQAPQWVKITKSYTDFAAAAFTNDISIYSLPAGGVIQDVIINPTISFSGGTIATYTLSIGKGGNLVLWSAPAPIFTGALISNAGFLPVTQLSAEDVRASVISTVGLLNAATQGSVDIYLLVAVLP